MGLRRRHFDDEIQGSIQGIDDNMNWLRKLADDLENQQNKNEKKSSEDEDMKKQAANIETGRTKVNGKEMVIIDSVTKNIVDRMPTEEVTDDYGTKFLLIKNRVGQEYLVSPSTILSDEETGTSSKSIADNVKINPEVEKNLAKDTSTAPVLPSQPNLQNEPNHQVIMDLYLNLDSINKSLQYILNNDKWLKSNDKAKEMLNHYFVAIKKSLVNSATGYKVASRFEPIVHLSFLGLGKKKEEKIKENYKIVMDFFSKASELGIINSNQKLFLDRIYNARFGEEIFSEKIDKEKKLKDTSTTSTESPQHEPQSNDVPKAQSDAASAASEQMSPSEDVGIEDGGKNRSRGRSRGKVRNKSDGGSFVSSDEKLSVSDSIDEIIKNPEAVNEAIGGAKSAATKFKMEKVGILTDDSNIDEMKSVLGENFTIEDMKAIYSYCILLVKSASLKDAADAVYLKFAKAKQAKIMAETQSNAAVNDLKTVKSPSTEESYISDDSQLDDSSIIEVL